MVNPKTLFTLGDITFPRRTQLSRVSIIRKALISSPACRDLFSDGPFQKKERKKGGTTDNLTRYTLCLSKAAQPRI